MPLDMHADVGQFLEEKVNLIAGLAFLQAIVTQLVPDNLNMNPDFVAVRAGMELDAGV
jgi:hypothetical protein